MKIGLGIGIPFIRNYISSLFDPSKLFTGSTNGVWYDPSDINLTWRRNLLTYSEQFDNAAWAKASVSVTANAEVAPDGTTTADLLTPSSSDSNLQRDFTPIGVDTYVFSVWFKSATGSNISLQLVCNRVVPYTIAQTQVITVTPVWQRFTLQFTTLDSSTHNFAVGRASSFETGENIYIWGAQLEQGSTATPYQRITDGIQDYLQYQAQPVLYRDAAGTQPVTAVEQPVGLMLDKSGKSPTTWLQKIADPSLTTTTGWSNPAVFSGGKYISGNSSYSLTATIGKLYRYTYVVSQASSGGLALYVCGVGVGSSSPIAAGTYSGTVIATSTKVFEFYNPGWGWTGQIDSVSVEELQGNHAFNSSGNSANFPVLSARVNLLTKSENVSDSYWYKSDVTTPDSVTLQDAATTNFHFLRDGNTTTFVSGVSYTVRVRLEKGTVAYGGVHINDGTSRGCSIDLTTGQLGTPYGGATASAVADGTGWVLTVTATAGTTTTTGHVAIYMSTSNALATYAGTGSGTIKVSKIDLRVTNDALNQPAYQRVNTSSDYDTVGFKPYLRFNGTNQWLQTNSIDLTYGDKMFVSAGVRKLSDVSVGVVTELSVSAGGGTSGTFVLHGQTSPVGYRYAAGSGASGAAFATDDASVFTAPITNVVSGISDFAGVTIADEISVRVNGAAPTQTRAGTVSTGNFGNYPLYIGARGGSSLWFNGRLYQMVIAGKQASAVEIDKTEDYIALKTGFTYPSISGVPTFTVVL